MQVNLQEFPERGHLVGHGRHASRVIYTPRTKHPIVYRVRRRTRRVEIIAIGNR